MNKTRNLLIATIMATLFCVATVRAQVAGQWDFESGNLTATTGSDLTYADGGGGNTQTGTSFGSTTSFGIPNIAGSPANVMKFPGSTNGTMGFNMPTPAANGRGTFVDNYTLILDVLYPAASDGKLRSTLQTDIGLVTPGSDFVVNSGNQVSADIAAGGTIAPGTWYRIGFVVQTNNLYGYVDGNQVFAGIASGSDLDRFDLGPSATALILGDGTTNTSAGGYVNSIQLRSSALSEGEMAALGGAAASGIPSSIPPVPSFIRAGRTPGVGAVHVVPKPNINIVLDQGSTIVNSSSIKLFFDNVLRSGAVVTPSAPTFTVTDSISTLLGSGSVHTLSLVWSDNAVGFKTNTWSFTVVAYQSLKLTAPFYLENFESTAEGALPVGWSVTNYTTPQTSGLDLCDPTSDSYLNWVIINTNRLCSGGPCTGSFECDALNENVYVVNGVQLDHLANGKIAFAESDNRNGEPDGQVNYMFSKDIDCSGRANVFVSWHSIYKQNQDNIASVEYSVNQGATWLPVIYYLDDENGNAEVIRTNGVIDVGATFGTPRPNQAGFYTNPPYTTLTTGLAYSNFIAAPVSAALIPYIQGRINDDDDFDSTGVYGSRKIELVRLPAADGAANVRFRFMQAGTCSWFFGVDEFGLYEIGFPIISTQPASQTRDAGTPVTFSVVASGTPTPQYQWLFNGGVISGATGSSYSFTADTGNAGGYSVIVSNSLDSVTSSTATLTVIAAPKIIGQPASVSVNAGVDVAFTISARGRAPIGYQWRKNGLNISGATTTILAINNAQLVNDALYACVASNSDLVVTSRTAYLKIVTNINQDLVVHLKFDNDYNDSSGRGNNANPIGSPGFAAGKIGQALQYTLPDGGTNADGSTAQNYVTLDNPVGTHPADLRFVDSASFSISLWYKVASGDRGGDPPIMSNKDWDSGSNDGVVVFNSGSGLRWNYREVDDGINSNTRKDSGSTSPGLEDNVWHHCVVVFNRGGNAGTYVDGNLVHVDPLATAQPAAVGGVFDPTTIDNDPTTNRTRTASGAWNIGEDGSGLYTSTLSGHDGPGIYVTNAMIDDVGMWRRALTPGEVAAIYTAGNAGNPLDTAANVTNPKPLNPSISISGANVVITKGNTMLLSAPTLAGPWTEITAARSVSVYSEPIGTVKYYRGAQP
jgi:hypothetical protein